MVGVEMQRVVVWSGAGTMCLVEGGGGSSTLMILLSEASRVTCLFMVLCFYGVI